MLVFKPEIGVSMLYTLGSTFHEMARQLATVDASLVEIVDDGFHVLSKKRVRILGEIAHSYGISYTVHAPFADINIASPSKQILKTSIKRLRQSMVYASMLDAKLWVFHPGMRTGISSFYPGRDWQQNNVSIHLLCKVAEEYGLRVALENLPEPYPFIMKSVDDFTRFYAETGLNVNMVLDVGHANINRQILPFLRAFNKRIVHLHASDNMGEFDEHLGIGYGKINWQDFAQALKEAGYDKTIVVESVFHVKESLEKLKQLLT